MDSFQNDPPNVALISDGSVAVIVELNKLRRSEMGLQYDVMVLSGDTGAYFSGCHLPISQLVSFRFDIADAMFDSAS